jgi:hypothetical protein
MKLKVFTIGAAWFDDALRKQGIEPVSIEWSPPVSRPRDIDDILSRLRR